MEEFKGFIVDINMTCAVTYPYAICVLVSSGCAVVLLTFNVSFLALIPFSPEVLPFAHAVINNNMFLKPFLVK